MKLRRVTITGADDSISPSDLVPLTEKYPFVEWGLLLSVRREGTARFPSNPWWAELAALPERLPACGHICGSWVRQICEGVWPTSLQTYAPMVQRWQLNFHAYQHLIKDADAFYRGCRAQARPIIFQLDGVNDFLWEDACAAGVMAFPLFDRSGGAGVLPRAWPPARGYSGYAGGLSPKNVVEQLQHIAAAAGDAPIWIDVETHVRSHSDRQFNLAKVEAFLAAAAPFVTKEG